MGGAGDPGLAILNCHTRAQIDPDTGEQSTSEEYVVRDTPLLVNIKGCGYPPDTMCDLFAEKYQNHSRAGETFPCHYTLRNIPSSKGNNWALECSLVLILIHRGIQTSSFKCSSSSS